MLRATFSMGAILAVAALLSACASSSAEPAPAPVSTTSTPVSTGDGGTASDGGSMPVKNPPPTETGGW